MTTIVAIATGTTTAAPDRRLRSVALVPVALVPVVPALVALESTTNDSLATQSVAENQHAVHAPGERTPSATWGTGRALPWVASAWLSRWHAVALPVVLALLALALSLPRLTTPNVYVFDELYYAYTAGKYVAGEEAYSTAVLPRDDPAIEWTHPPLAKLLIAGGILIAGDNPLGWRIVNALFGVAGVVILYSARPRLDRQPARRAPWPPGFSSSMVCIWSNPAPGCPISSSWSLPTVRCSP